MIFGFDFYRKRKKPLKLKINFLLQSSTYSRTTGSEVAVGVYRKRSLEKGIEKAVKALKQASMTWESNYTKAYQGTEGRHENIALVKNCFPFSFYLDFKLKKN